MIRTRATRSGLTSVSPWAFRIAGATPPPPSQVFSLWSGRSVVAVGWALSDGTSDVKSCAVEVFDDASETWRLDGEQPPGVMEHLTECTTGQLLHLRVSCSNFFGASEPVEFTTRYCFFP